MSKARFHKVGLSATQWQTGHCLAVRHSLKNRIATCRRDENAAELVGQGGELFGIVISLRMCTHTTTPDVKDAN